LNKSSVSPIHRNGWIKSFVDGQIESGYDDDVDAKRASWSKGRLTDMDGASIHHEGYHIAIAGLGEYWQSDDWDVPLFTSAGELAVRRLQRKLVDGDTFIVYYQTPNSMMLRVVSTVGEAEMEQYTVPVKDEYIGMWMWMEYHCKVHRINWGLSKERI
jgi:hypothetical protein